MTHARIVGQSAHVGERPQVWRLELGHDKPHHRMLDWVEMKVGVTGTWAEEMGTYDGGPMIWCAEVI